ncbi:MAG: molybdenum cofactor sulfurase, partial [Rhodobiaceae bacterium]|nr:molybdenum cofactor sulfurase [Rhodobiaceae bacterium]
MSGQDMTAERGQAFDDPQILPVRTMSGRVEAVYAAFGQDDFETANVEALELGFEGVPGDRHRGFEREAGAREPWYPRGTAMRNERQLSLVSPDELAAVAEGMGIDDLSPRWIGANLLISGVPRLSMLPAGTLMFFENGATVKIDGQNAPCRYAGAAIAKRYPDRDGLALAFPKVA